MGNKTLKLGLNSTAVSSLLKILGGLSLDNLDSLDAEEQSSILEIRTALKRWYSTTTDMAEEVEEKFPGIVAAVEETFGVKPEEAPAPVINLNEFIERNSSLSREEKEDAVQAYFDAYLKKARDEYRATKPGLSLGQLIVELESQNQFLPIHLRHCNPDVMDYDDCAPGQFCSYRGDYHELCLLTGGVYSRGEFLVKDFLSRCINADGEVFEGYKGGEYVMHRDCLVYVEDSQGDWSGNLITKVEQINDAVYIFVDSEPSS